MKAFRTLLAVFSIVIISYTGVVGARHGWNLLPIFFGDMAAMTWPGQFNVDIMCFLILAGVWIAWRHQFSAGGLAMGVICAFLGMMMLAPYLLIASFIARGDLIVLLLGKSRAERATLLPSA
ncbi:MAG: hypothetical protein QNJ22_05220 [Desulfosarcinaceae bacterium]|nr:hypothetical protein [Desulfosarcinaceae bacterium]